MDRLALLNSENNDDNLLLETDIMRFMAIIGIVFWIIFAMIKSIPFKTPETKLEIIPPIQNKKFVSDIPPDKNAPKAEKNAQKSMPQTLPELTGIQIQFKSLEDLLTLMKTHKVKIFGNARASGFDLFFEAYPKGESIIFKGTSRLPSKLWEIKSGKDHAYFQDLMAKTYPSIRSFSTRNVFVSFIDRELEKDLEQDLIKLENEGKNGILSITRAGDIEFHNKIKGAIQ